MIDCEPRIISGPNLPLRTMPDSTRIVYVLPPESSSTLLIRMNQTQQCAAGKLTAAESGMCDVTINLG